MHIMYCPTLSGNLDCQSTLPLHQQFLKHLVSASPRIEQNIFQVIVQFCIGVNPGSTSNNLFFSWLNIMFYTIYIYIHIYIKSRVYVYIYILCLYYMHIITRSQFRSQTSDNMDRWKSRGWNSQRRKEKNKEDKRRERVRGKKMQVREKVAKSQFTLFFQ